MNRAIISLLALMFILIGTAAWANNPIDEFSFHRHVRMLDDNVVCLSEHACSMERDCYEINQYEWWSYEPYNSAMLASGAAGSSWLHYQEPFLFQKHHDAMVDCVKYIEELCEDVLDTPPNNWLIHPYWLNDIRAIKGYIPDLEDELADIQYWINVSFPNRDYQQIWLACENIEMIECELHSIIKKIACESSTVLLRVRLR